MPDRSLILPGGAVRAVLREVEAPGSGKSQHRVVLKPDQNGWYRTYHDGRPCGWSSAPEHGSPFAPGDRIWVQETWARVPPSTARSWGDVPWRWNPDDDYEAAIFRASFDRSAPGTSWRSAATMPRWASRLTLIVTDARVQRVQDISEEDARAEGVAFEVAVCRGADDDLRNEPSYRGGFANRWAEQHGPDAWARNDWVAAVAFRPHARNIDMEADNG